MGGIGNAATSGPGAPDSGSLARPRWDDLSSPIVAGARLDTSSGRLDYDFFNGAVNFNSNARYPEEPVVIPLQLPHSALLGSGAVLRPHIHWYQEQSSVPNFLLAYKIIPLGSAVTKETDYSGHTFLTIDNHLYNYTSGILYQLSEFPEIDISSVGISTSIDIVLFRDSANASGEFAGADPVVTDVLVKWQDQHVQFDGQGSRQEFVK